MSVLSTLNELKNITDNFHLNSNKDTVFYGIVDFQNPLDISEKNHIEDIFKKFEFIKNEINNKNIIKDKKNVTIIFKDLFDIQFPFFPQIIQFLILDYLEYIPNNVIIKDDKILFSIKAENKFFSSSREYYRPIFFILRHIFHNEQNFLSLFDMKQQVQTREDYNIYFTLNNQLYDVKKFIFTHSKTNFLVNTHMSVDDFIKLPENFLNKFIQTNNQSINLSKGLDSFRELFNQKELKTFKIKNHSQVSEYINKFELVFNYTCSQSIDPSILHNIMLQCKLHGTTDKVINSIRTKPKV